jgi:hypothetical protein
MIEKTLLRAAFMIEMTLEYVQLCNLIFAGFLQTKLQNPALAWPILGCSMVQICKEMTNKNLCSFYQLPRTRS